MDKHLSRCHDLVCDTAEKFMSSRNTISLANGMPNAETFPIEEIAVTYKSGAKIKLVGEELCSSLQYGPSQG